MKAEAYFAFALSRETDGKVAQLAQFPWLDFLPREEDGVPVLCVECARNYEIEASAVRAKAEGTNLALTFFPGWPQADEPQTSHKVIKNQETQHMQLQKIRMNVFI